MFKNISISTKITFLMLLVILFAITTIGYIAFQFAQVSLKEKYLQNIEAVAVTKRTELSNYLHAFSNQAVYSASNQNLQKLLGIIDNHRDTNPDSIDAITQPVFEGYFSSLSTLPGLLEAHLTYKNGGAVYTTTNESFGQQIFIDDMASSDKAFINDVKSNFAVSKLRHDNGQSYFWLGMPMNDDSGNRNWTLLFKVDFAAIQTALNDFEGLGETGEYILGADANDQILFLNTLRLDSVTNSIVKVSAYAGPLQMAIQGQAGSAQTQDYNGNAVLAAWQHIPMTNWGLVVKINEYEYAQEASGLRTNFIVAGVIIAVLATVIAFIFSNFLVTPLFSLQSVIQLLGKGVLPESVETKSNDEIGQMAEAVGDVVQSLRRTASFAQNIGQGNFDADFKPLSERDTLGLALLNMRDSIQESEIKDKERNWIVTGVAEVGEILRMHNELGLLGDDVISFITDKIDAVQGAFYVVNEADHEDGDDVIEMMSSYAYNKKKYLKAQFKFAEGLVGQAAIEQDTILRTEIPDDYVTITSGLLGDKRPNCILIVPMITDEKVFGVLEFAGFERFTERQIKFVQEISVIIARTVFNIKVNERTRTMLEESQKMSDELQIQQNELRQNAEEMEATQEELRRTNQRLEDQIEEVNRTQNRMQILLQNASEVISIYEEDHSVRYISPSVERILGYESTEMIGSKDTDNVHPEYKEAYEDMFRELLDKPFETVTLQFQYRRKDGDMIWLEATGKNLLSDPSIQGLVVNMRDITERRRAEQEERMRSKMQALSENSPDLITRVDQEGSFFYINPVIETYTGQNANHFLNQSIDAVDMDQRIVDEWKNILQNVYDSNEKVAVEMDFPSVMGDRIMQVNAIPEYNEEEHIESVLVVSHDITERKLIELEIASKNKKISESINYAKRIQGAILPNNSIIRKVLPQSFIFYRARDVVSGDFPWFMKIGNNIFIAAVDCTGHGVPGALISLIGYFLLNDIVRSRKVDSPGKILDQLDEGVTQTLRQDQDDSRTKDGMDIALCKINLELGQVEYAGAHRPLYFIKDGQLQEIKGNKFPIGGGIYKNQTNFTNNVIEVNSGDSIFFCSDGFPDQFGGPDNRKFGPKRLRQMLQDNHDKPMVDVYDTIANSWDNWKGNQKQTDDVLLIGIRF